MSRVRPSMRSMGLAIVLATLAATLTITGGPAAAAPEEGFRLIRPVDEVETVAFDGRVSVSLPVLIAAYGVGLEVEVTRPDVESRVRGTVHVIHDDETHSTLMPRRLIKSFLGFDDAIRIEIRDEAGDVVDRRTLPWCPNSYSRQRVDPTGPALPEYPEYCSAHPFTSGMVWGIERGWATPVAEYFDFPGTIGTYTVEVRLARGLANALDIPKRLRSASVTVDVTDDLSFGEGEFPVAVDAPATGLTPRHSDIPRPRPPVAQGAPDPATLPDLVSLPAYEISTSFSPRSGKDRLNFFANEWNAGPAPMVIEGFRRGSRALMDSYQVLYDGDEPAEWREVGTMEFHEAPQHNHWHFLDFAKYDLVDADGNPVARSGKQSWCLVPTDAIDLTVEGAEWRPGQTGLQTACGGPEAMWIREILPVGWGDTYSQYQTQAINITEVPNGTYWLRIVVNPDGNIYEVTEDNNVSLRRVILGGEPGARTVRVPPVGLIDTDGGGGDIPVG